jgi:hypothetical protein
VDLQRDAVRRLVVVGLCAVWAWQSHQYVRVWRSDVTLWQHAAVMAPHKPRALLNAGTMQVVRGRFADARALFQLAQTAAQLPHVPPWDRQLAREDAAGNLAALDKLEARLAR